MITVSGGSTRPGTCNTVALLTPVVTALTLHVSWFVGVLKQPTMYQCFVIFFNLCTGNVKTNDRIWIQLIISDPVKVI